MSRGLGYVQLSVLRALAEGRPRDGQLLGQLGEAEALAGVHRTSIGRAVLRLEELGWVKTERLDADIWSRGNRRLPYFRAKYVTLTSSGLERIGTELFNEAVAELTDEAKLYTPEHLGHACDAKTVTAALGPLVQRCFDAVFLLKDARGGTHGRPTDPALLTWMSFARQIQFDWDVFIDSY